MARALQFQSKKNKYKDLKGRVEEAANQPVIRDEHEDAEAGGSSDEESIAHALDVLAIAPAGTEAAAAQASEYLTSSLRKLDFDAFDGLVNLASDSDLSGADDDGNDDDDDDDEGEAAESSGGLGSAKRSPRTSTENDDGSSTGTDLGEPPTVSTTETNSGSQRVEEEVEEGEPNNLEPSSTIATPLRKQVDDDGEDDEHEDDDSDDDDYGDDSDDADVQRGYGTPSLGGAPELGYDPGSPFTPGGGFGQRRMSEDEYRNYVVQLVFSQLFPDEEDEAGEELDNFEVGRLAHLPPTFVEVEVEVVVLLLLL